MTDYTCYRDGAAKMTGDLVAAGLAAFLHRMLLWYGRQIHAAGKLEYTYQRYLSIHSSCDSFLVEKAYARGIQLHRSLLVQRRIFQCISIDSN